MINKTSIYEQLTTLPYLSAYQQLRWGAIELEVFSELEKPITAKELSEKKNWDEGNTFYILKGLYSLGYLERKGDAFCNMPETEKYLVKGKPTYMGSMLPFVCNNQGMSLENVAQQVKEGPKPQKHTQQSIDFAAYGEAMRDAQSEYVNMIVGNSSILPEYKSIHKILDLGCGTGCLGIAAIRDVRNRKGVLFDKPDHEPLIEETVNFPYVRAFVKMGTFEDDIGSGYI